MSRRHGGPPIFTQAQAEIVVPMVSICTRREGSPSRQLEPQRGAAELRCCGQCLLSMAMAPVLRTLQAGNEQVAKSEGSLTLRCSSMRDQQRGGWQGRVNKGSQRKRCTPAHLLVMVSFSQATQIAPVLERPQRPGRLCCTERSCRGLRWRSSRPAAAEAERRWEQRRKRLTPCPG